MKRLIDLTGKGFGRWNVIKFSGRNKYGQATWLCKCDCGNEKIILGNSLRNGDSKSCGCLAKEILIKRSVTHGYTRNKKISKTYRIWTLMNRRCKNKNSLDYKDYGGKGIKICYRWSSKNKNGYKNFLMDMGECPKNGYSIDRIKNKRGYNKINCRWATYKEQARNRSSNHLIPFNGKRLCIAEWSEITGIKQSVISTRLKRGWSIERTLTTPTKIEKTNV